MVESVSEVRRHFSSVRFAHYVDRSSLSYVNQLIITVISMPAFESSMEQTVYRLTYRKTQGGSVV